MTPKDRHLKIDELRELLSYCESILNELRDDRDSPKLSDAHRNVSEAVTNMQTAK